jgi:xylulokinase
MSPPENPCVLAVDLGGSSLRVALIGRDGGVRALHAQPHRVALGADGAGEGDPEAWWQGLVAGAAALREAAPGDFARIGAIAVTAFTRSLVLLDAVGAVIRPALLWQDTRAGAALPALPPGHPEAAQMNAFHPLARLAWLARQEPASLARLATVLEPKDALNHRLTGRRASDRISAARLLGARDLLAGLGLSGAVIPPLHRPHAVMGQVLPGLPGALAALAGLPVLTMAHDTWAAVLGLGALRLGHAYAISGTTEVLGLLHDRAVAAEGLMTVDWDGLWQIGGPSQHGADALAWLREMGMATAEPPPGLLPILFLPSLEGERVPHWDARLRGAFLGLRRSHGAAAMTQAVMQGVALNSRTVLERAETASGRTAVELRLGGGGATPAWAQLRADILGRPVVLTEAAEPGLLGCAIAGFAALEGRSLDPLQAELARPRARFLPDPARHAEATRLHALFRAAEAAVAPLSHALAGFEAPS